MIQEAWIGDVSARRVEDLVQAMGLGGISNSQVSKLCEDIDERVQRSSTARSPVIGRMCDSMLDGRGHRRATSGQKMHRVPNLT